MYCSTIDADGAGPVDATGTWHVSHNDDVWADYDAAGQAVARYLGSGVVDDLLARWRASDAAGGTDGRAW